MPQTTARTRRQKVEEKERAILAATRAVFRDQGPERAKITEIAKAANLAEGTVYLYFKNKQALLLAAVSDFYAELTRDAEAAVKPAEDTSARLAVLAQMHFSRVLEHWSLIAEAMSRYLPSPDYRETEAYALNRRYVAVFDAVIREGQARGDIKADLSVAAMRDMFYGGLEHLARSARLRNAKLDAEAEVSQFLSIFTSGIMGHPAQGGVDGALVARRLQRIIDDIEEQMQAGQT